MIDDSSLAIDAYLADGDDDEKKVGRKYLKLYGLLQALFIQQDAAMNLSEAFEIPDKITNYPTLKEIRELRNDCVGHPTKRAGKDKISYNYIGRFSLEKDGFMLLTESNMNKGQFRQIDINGIICPSQDAILGLIHNTFF